MYFPRPLALLGVEFTDRVSSRVGLEVLDLIEYRLSWLALDLGVGRIPHWCQKCLIVIEPRNLALRSRLGLRCRSTLFYSGDRVFREGSQFDLGS